MEVFCIFLKAGLIVALLVSSSSASAQPNLPADCGRAVHAKEARAFQSKVFSPKQWQRGEPPKRTKQRHRKNVRCAAGPGHRKAIRRGWKQRRAEFRAHREKKLAQRERLRYLPFACGGGVRSAIPCSIMFCESGGSYTARNSESTAGGKYQIIDSTWFAYGGVDNGDSHPAAAAPPEEQDRIALDIWNNDGPGAWVCT